MSLDPAERQAAEQRREGRRKVRARAQDRERREWAERRRQVLRLLTSRPQRASALRSTSPEPPSLRRRGRCPETASGTILSKSPHAWVGGTKRSTFSMDVVLCCHRVFDSGGPHLLFIIAFV